MRGFFLLLLLTNVAFLGWQYWQYEPTGEIDIYRGVGAENDGLRLLSELDPEQRPALREGQVAEQQPIDQAEEEPATVVAIEKPVGDSVKASTRLCPRVGEIAGRSELDKLVAGLKQLGASRLQEGSGQSQKTNYWVMLPPYENRDKAAEAASILKQQRVRDFFIVRSGEYENAVSLGVFSTEERAQRRYEQIAALKARLRKPRIEAIALPAKRFTLQFELSSEGGREGVTKLLKQQGLSNAEEIRCK